MTDEPRCTLVPGQYGTCLCTGRAGCQATNDDLGADDWDDPDWSDDVPARPVVTLELPGISR